MFGISKRKWVSIAFLLATILISLILAGTAYIVAEPFDGMQPVSAPYVFPDQPNSGVIPMSSTTPVMPALAIAGDFKAQLVQAELAVPNTEPTKQTAVFNNLFGMMDTETFTTGP